MKDQERQTPEGHEHEGFGSDNAAETFDTSDSDALIDTDTSDQTATPNTESLGQALWQRLSGLNRRLDSLENTIPPLQAALSAHAEGISFFRGSHARSLKLYLQALSDQMDDLNTVIPSLENALGSRIDQTQESALRRMFGKKSSELKDQLRALSVRLDTLEYTIPRLEFAISARAEAIVGELEPEKRANVYDIKNYLEDLAERIQTLRGSVNPLEMALASRVPEPAPEPVYLLAWMWLAGLYAAMKVYLLGRFRKEPQTATLGDIIDRQRGSGPVVFEDYDERRAAWQESWWSRRRMRYAILPFALLALTLGYGTAAYLNGDYQKQAFAKTTVRQMEGAPSYMAVGSDIVRTSSAVQEVREQFMYISPSQVQTSYHTSARDVGGGGSLPVDCAEKEIVIISSTRYQYCADDDKLADGWSVDSFDPAIFTQPIFRPWVRFSWCRKIQEDPELQMINGAETRLYSCEIPNAVEAELESAWQSPEEGSKEAEALERFLSEGSVDISIWVRQEDGYIGRFSMTKTSPQGSSMVTETVDYLYTGFSQVPKIEPPDSHTLPSSGATDIGDTVQAQQLNLPETVTIGGVAFNLDVAADDASLARGLSNRTLLAQDAGMLFVFPTEELVTFWMKDMLFDVDVLFINSSGSIIDIQTMQTESGVVDEQLTRYQSSGPALFALEINAGLAEQFGFQVGMQALFE
ncbi:MAG: DUF192 domain-containing protein [SAR202 cluster bacterium]|jgi:hypothetical protein|nr:DUF192 domain-containing protein [SAR202 cluster bacterium]MDP6713778.1 DUF192 domain-containing protein [SAR202 cluster bacterium]